MQVRTYDIDAVAPDARLRAYQDANIGYEVLPVGDSVHLASRVRAVSLGDVKLVGAYNGPIHFRRRRATIEADSKNHISVEYYVSGAFSGTLGEREVSVAAGEATVMDTAREVDALWTAPTDSFIINIPRYMLQELFPTGIPHGRLAAGPALALAMAQVRYIFDHAEAISDEAAALLGRSLRSLVAAAMLTMPPVDDGGEYLAPLQRIRDLLDRFPSTAWDARSIAAQLAVDEPLVSDTTARFGGLDKLREEQRLRAAYRQLSDPAETALISQIARRSGYAEDAQFSRDFRKVFSGSPKDTRMQRSAGFLRWAGGDSPETGYAIFRTDN